MKQLVRLAPCLTVAVTLWSCTVVYNQPPGSSAGSDLSASQNRPTIQSDSATDDWRPSNLAETIQACRAIASANDIPITCDFRYVEDAPMMTVGFPNIDTAESYIEAVNSYVSAPFCASANSANRTAYLILIVSSVNRGNIFSCESAEDTGWFDLDLLESL